MLTLWRRSTWALGAAVVGAVLVAGSWHPRPAWVRWSAQATTARSWDEVLARPGPIAVQTLVTGRLTAPRGMNVNRRAPAAAGLDDALVSAEVLAHLVRHETQGELLVDAGLSAAFAASAYGDVPGLLVPLFMGRGDQRPGEALGAQLARLGAHPRAVFLTHAHPDHTSGLVELPAATAVVAGPGERPPPYLWPLFFLDHIGRFEAVHALDFTGAAALPPLGRALDLLGDGSLWAIEAHGHTEGSVMYLVNGRQGAVLLTGDACPTRWSLEHGVESGLADDREAAQALMPALQAFVAAHPQVRIVFGHER